MTRSVTLRSEATTLAPAVSAGDGLSYWDRDSSPLRGSE